MMAEAVACDTSAVRHVLLETIELVQAHGGSLHPQVRLIECRGQFKVTCDAPRGGSTQPLFCLPRHLLVPLEGAVWSQRTDCLELLQAPPELSSVQRQLLDLHVALYNSTGKLPWWLQHHPLSRLSLQPDFAEALIPFRASEQLAPTNAAEGFLYTRTFSLKPLPTRQLAADPGLPCAPHPPRAKVLMPLIDLLNHHPHGAAFKVNESTMTVQVAQPGTDAECYANYGGRKDCLGLALHYGYVDHHTPFAHSAVLDLDLPGVGRVRVEQQRMRGTHPADPPRLTFLPDQLVISHVCCHLHYPNRVVGVLGLALRGLGMRRGLSATAAVQAATEAIGAVGAANVTLLNRLASVCKQLAPDFPAADCVSEAAQRQAMIFESVMRPH